MKRLLPTYALATLGCHQAKSPGTVTESSTYRNPASSGREFWKIAVWARAGLATRQQMEASTVAALRAQRVDAIASVEVWPIDASDEEIKAKVKAKDIGAIFEGSNGRDPACWTPNESRLAPVRAPR
jgi:hypothetical protein